VQDSKQTPLPSYRSYVLLNPYVLGLALRAWPLSICLRGVRSAGFGRLLP
jgi:hypothetical protein